MFTALQIIERAFSKIGVKAAETPLTASEIQDGLDALNDLLAQWNINGVLKSAVPVKEVNNILKLPRHSFRALKANLALELAPEYDREISISLHKIAEDSLSNLLKISTNLSNIRYPSTLPTGSGNQSDVYEIGDFFPNDPKRNF